MGFFSTFFFLKDCYVKSASLLSCGKIIHSLCAQFRCAANLTVSLLIKREVDNTTDAPNCSWYQVLFSVFIAPDLQALHALLLTLPHEKLLMVLKGFCVKNQ